MSSKKEKKQGNLTYLHKVLQQSVKDGKSTTLEESVIDGPKGISIKFFSKSGDNSEKIVIFGKDDSFTMKSADGEKTLSKVELLEELKSNKKLKFATEFAKTQKGGNVEQVVQAGGAKKSSKKSSKKVSKKASKKGSKKASKTQKGGVKKGSKKGSKKSSKKGSKKASKKRRA